MFNLFHFDVKVKATGKVLCSIGGYGNDRVAARKDAQRNWKVLVNP